MAGRKGPSRTEMRRAARLAIVQALYQMELTGAGVVAVIGEFTEHRFGHLPGEGSDPNPLEHADPDFFAKVVAGVVAEQGVVDQAILARLADGWRLDRIESIARAALRAGTWELLRLPDVPVAVVIDEYVGVVRAFFDGAEGGFVNGLLDRLAQETGAAALRAPS